MDWIDRTEVRESLPALVNAVTKLRVHKMRNFLDQLGVGSLSRTLLHRVRYQLSQLVSWLVNWLHNVFYRRTKFGALVDDTDREKLKYSEKPCATITSSTTNWSELRLEKNVRSGETILELWSCKTSLDSFHPARTELSIAAPFQRYKAITKDRIEFVYTCQYVIDRFVCL